MEDSLSDTSERNKSQNSQNSDQQLNDAHMIAEAKNAQLIEQNAQLTKINDQLKAQLDQALNIEPQIEKLHEQNRQLTSENRSVKEEKDDLQKRFDILQKTNSDLQKKVDEEKQHCTVARNQCSENAKKEIKKAKAQAKAQMEELCDQLESLQAKYDKNEIELKTVNNKVERLLENATRYFGQEFHDIDTFISFLSGSFPSQGQNNQISHSQSSVIATPVHRRTAPATPLIATSASMVQQTPNFIAQQAPNTVTQLEKKLKREKSKTKTLTTDKDELEISIGRLKREMNDLNNKHKVEIDKLKSKAKETKEEQDLTDANTQHTIKTLENKVETLTRKNEELKKKVQEYEMSSGIPQPQFPDQNQQNLSQYPNDQQAQSPYIANQASLPAYYSPIQQPLFSPANPNQPNLAKTSSSPLSHPYSRSVTTTPKRTQLRENEGMVHECPSSEHLVNQNIDLNEQLKSSKNRMDDLVDRLKKSESQRNNLQLQLEKEKSENNSLKIVHSNTVNELGMLREALHMKESVKDRNDKKLMRREFNEQKAQLEGVTQELKSLKKQLTESITEHQRDLANITDLKREIEDLKDEKERLKKEADNVREELSTVQAEFESHVRNEITPETLIPMASWQGHDFPGEINAGISKIACNPSLQPASKLKSVYKVISKKYGEMISSRDKLLDQSYSENQQIRDIVNEFVSDITIALDMKPIGFNDFFKDKPQQTIIDTIKNFRSCHDDLKRSNDQLTQTLSRVHQTFGAVGLTSNTNGSPGGFNGINAFPSLEDITYGMEKEVNSVKTQLSTTSDQLQKRTKKCKELASALKTLKKKTENDAEDSKQEIQRLKSLSESLKRENGELSKSVKELRWKLQSLTTEYDDYKLKHEEESKDLDEKLESQAKIALIEKQRLEANYQEQIRMISEQCNDTSEYLTEHQDQLTKLKQEVETQKAIIAQKDIEIERLKEEHDENYQTHDIRLIDEKKNLITSYEKAVAEQKQQCEGHRSDVEKMTKQLAATEKKLKHSKEKIIQIQKEKVNMEVELRNQIDQVERQKKLIETSSKVELMNAQTAFNSKLEEESAKFEEEKRRIYSTIADTFRQYLGIGSNLNEKSFKSTLFKARDELARLTSLDNSVRRLVNAEPNQKTDDAVAQFVISQSKE